MHAELAATIAHHHGTVPREAAAIDVRKAQPFQTRQQIRRTSRRRVEREIELNL